MALDSFSGGGRCGSATCDTAFWPDDDLDGCNSTDDADEDDFWDFFDMPDSNGLRDRKVTSADSSAVQARYGANDDSGNADINRDSDPLMAPPATGYHPAFDRGASLAPPDGAIGIVDILAVAAQVGDDCS